MPVYEADTGKPVEFEDPNDLYNAITSGTHTFKKGQKITVYDPEKPEEVWQMNADKYKEALDMGYVFETGFQKSVREYVDENKGFVGGAKVFAGELANELLFTVPEIVYRNTQDPLEVAKINALRDEYETASIAGTIGGIGANIYGLAKTGVLAATEKGASKAVGAVASRLRNTVGKDKLSQAAAERAAKSILEKTAKNTKGIAGAIGRGAATGAITGAIDMVPAGVTESAFGNYEEAAEALALGAGFGGLIGGVLPSISRMSQDASAVKAAGAEKSVAEVTGELDEGILRGIAKQATSAGLNIPEDIITNYVKNLDKVPTTRSFDEIYGDLQGAISKQKARLDQAEEAYRQADQSLNAAFAEARNEFTTKASQPNAEMASRLIEDINRTKSWLGEKSEEAYEVLAEEIPDIVRKQEILDLFENSIARQNRAIGSNSKAQNKIRNLMDEVNEQYDDVIDGVGLRDIMRDLRREADFSPALADFDELYSRYVKGVSENLSDKIKELSPGYKSIMDEMRPVAQSLDGIGQYIKKEDQARDLARDIAKSKKTGRDQVKAEKFDEFINSLETYVGLENTRFDYDTILKDQRDAVTFAEEAKKARAGTPDQYRTFLKERFPEISGERDRLLSEFERAKNEYESIRPIATGELEAKMRRIGWDRPNRDKELKRALEELSTREGLTGLSDELKLRQAIDALDQARPQGSRATLGYSVFGGSLGAALGFAGLGPLGYIIPQALGAAAGLYVDRYGGKMFKKILDSDTPMGSIFRGILTSEEQLGKIAKSVDGIPDSIKRLDKKNARIDRYNEATQLIRRSTNRIINSIIQSERSEKAGEPRTVEEMGEIKAMQEAFKVLQKRFAQTEDPLFFTETIEPIANGLSMGSAPNVANAFIDKTMSGIGYLKEQIPKNPAPSSPFQDPEEWLPSDYDLTQFMDKVVIAGDPFIVFSHLERGDLQKFHVEALEAIYPAIGARFTQKILETIQSEKLDISYSDKMALSYAIGQPADTSMSAQSFSFYQKPMAEVEQREAPPMGERFNVRIDTRDYETTMQRLG